MTLITVEETGGEYRVCLRVGRDKASAERAAEALSKMTAGGALRLIAIPATIVCAVDEGLKALTNHYGSFSVKVDGGPGVTPTATLTPPTLVFRDPKAGMKGKIQEAR